MTIVPDNQGIERNLNWKPSPPDNRDFQLQQHFPVARMFQEHPALLPQRVDLSHSALPIEDQSYIGSCTAFAGGGLFECVSNLTGKRAFSTSKLAMYFWNRQNGGFPITEDTGAYIRDILSTLTNQGAPHAETWPYNPQRFTETPPQAAYQDGAKYKATK